MCDALVGGRKVGVRELRSRNCDRRAAPATAFALIEVVEAKVRNEEPLAIDVDSAARLREKRA
jgi:hypothetical protein